MSIADAYFFRFLFQCKKYLQIDSADTKNLYFSHQYFRDFFAAKFIVNLPDALHIGYANVPEQLAYLFQNTVWDIYWYRKRCGIFTG